jgi:hypothetical protein
LVSALDLRSGVAAWCCVPSPKFILLLTKGLIREPRARRVMMFYLTLASLALLFCGAVLLDRWLSARPLLFVAWWGVCAWFMLAAVLLAVFDLLLVRAAARREQRDLARKILSSDDDPDAR